MLKLKILIYWKYVKVKYIKKLIVNFENIVGLSKI